VGCGKGNEGIESILEAMMQENIYSLIIIIFMVEIREFAIASVLAYKPLLKKRIGTFPTKIFRLAYLKSAKRSRETEMILNKIEVHLSQIFEILDSPSYKEMLQEYARKATEKIKERYSIIKTIKISEEEFKDFEDKLKKIAKMIVKTDEIYPLSYYLSQVLEYYPEMVRVDYYLLKKMKKEKYLSLVEEGFEKFPEKIIFFQAPIIALYLAFGGYRRMNLMQLSRLTGIFHTFIHLSSPAEGGIVELGKEVEKIPAFVKR